jgi:3-oxoacyl-[acyl-carrier protein] reductase
MDGSDRNEKLNVIITGGATGIGRACSELFAEKGYNVVIGYNSSAPEARELVKKLRASGFSAVSKKADLSRPAGAGALVEACLSRFGAPDVLVNNAGLALPQKLITETSPEEFRAVMDVNIGGTFNMCREALPHMIRRHSGVIVNVSSIWGRIGGSCEVAYSASKGAVISFTKALAKEVGPAGIRVNCVAPGVIDTRMNAHLDEETKKALADAAPLCRLGTPEEVARAVYYLASDQSSYVTGAVLDVDGGGI